MVDADKCPICWETFDNDESTTYLDCAHLYHTACIKKWKKKTCPVCREPITVVEIDDNDDQEDDNDVEVEDYENDVNDHEEEEEDEPSSRSISIREENNQHDNMHWPIVCEPLLPARPQQGWSNHASIHPPNSTYPQWRMVGESYIPVAQPHIEWGGYENHVPHISSVMSPVAGEPPRPVHPNWWDIIVVENGPRSSSLQLPVTEITVCLVFLCLYLVMPSLWGLFDGPSKNYFMMAIVTVVLIFVVWLIGADSRQSMGYVEKAY